MTLEERVEGSEVWEVCDSDKVGCVKLFVGTVTWVDMTWEGGIPWVVIREGLDWGWVDNNWGWVDNIDGCCVDGCCVDGCCVHGCCVHGCGDGCGDGCWGDGCGNGCCGDGVDGGCVDGKDGGCGYDVDGGCIDGGCVDDGCGCGCDKEEVTLEVGNWWW